MRVGVARYESVMEGWDLERQGIRAWGVLENRYRLIKICTVYVQATHPVSEAPCNSRADQSQEKTRR